MNKTTALVRCAIVIIFITLPVCSLIAQDAGLILDNSASYEGAGDTPALKYSSAFIPWFSAPLGESVEFYASVRAAPQYENREWSIVPELLCTELTWRIREDGTVKAGRMTYADPLGFIAAGLFDGARYLLDFANGSILGIGAWYTGFLYKKSINITMTGDELELYAAPLDYGDFFNTYFAPRRLVAAADWEHPGLKDLIRLNLALISQFDLSGSDSLYHSQYLIAKAVMPFNAFVFELGTCVELAENANQFKVSFSGEAGVSWFLPTQINDRLLFLCRYSSGETSDAINAFVPITSEPEGNIIKEKISGLSTLKLDYTVRLYKSFSIGFKNTYFILSDLKTYTGPPFGRDGYFLGNEFYCQVIWCPLSDIRIIGGAGAFLPSLGNAGKLEDIMWKVDLGVMLALF
jgi:hypothetical protein